MSLTTRVLIGMLSGLLLGVVLRLLGGVEGTTSPLGAFLDTYLVSGVFEVVGKVFVISLKLLVVPLVFVSLVCGTSALGEDNRRMGPMAGKTILLYLLTTGIAISMALMMAVLVGPGVGINLGEETTYAAKEAPSIKQVIINIFPANPVKAMAEGNMLQIIVFALLFGVAVSKSETHGKKIGEFFTSLNEVVMKMVTLLMELAPYGVFCLMAKLFANLGIDAIVGLLKYFLTVLAVLLLHGLGVYSILLKTLSGLNPLMFLKKIRPVWLFAFSTASSGATIPVTLKTVEQKLGVKNTIASFTVPLGATINMDGTAIMQGVATVFIAQAFNIDIGIGGYLMVILTATLASIGTAGVPGVGLITLAMVLQQVGLPVEGIALIIGVDRLLDMVRTAVNVTGDSMVSCVVAKTEKELDTDWFNKVDAESA